jgi:hypothetical protein
MRELHTVCKKRMRTVGRFRFFGKNRNSCLRCGYSSHTLSLLLYPEIRTAEHMYAPRSKASRQMQMGGKDEIGMNYSSFASDNAIISEVP